MRPNRRDEFHESHTRSPSLPRQRRYPILSINNFRLERHHRPHRLRFSPSATQNLSGKYLGQQKQDGPYPQRIINSHKQALDGFKILDRLHMSVQFKFKIQTQSLEQRHHNPATPRKVSKFCWEIPALGFPGQAINCAPAVGTSLPAQHVLIFVP